MPFSEEAKEQIKRAQLNEYIEILHKQILDTYGVEVLDKLDKLYKATKIKKEDLQLVHCACVTLYNDISRLVYPEEVEECEEEY